MKKMLVPFDEKMPRKKINDFIYPELSEREVYFVGIKKPKKWNKGMVVYTGVEITASEIVAKLIHYGKKLDAVDDTFKILQEYVSQLGEFKIGTILEIQQDEIVGFKLRKFADRISPIEPYKIP